MADGVKSDHDLRTVHVDESFVPYTFATFGNDCTFTPGVSLRWRSVARCGNSIAIHAPWSVELAKRVVSLNTFDAPSY
jgi:hypothetical protein